MASLRARQKSKSKSDLVQEHILKKPRWSTKRGGNNFESAASANDVLTEVVELDGKEVDIP